MKKTTVDLIKEKINELPEDYAKHVTITAPGMANVTSFTNPESPPYNVKIGVDLEVEGGLLVKCNCPATTALCKHVAAYYAVAKHIEPKPPIIVAIEEKAKELSGYKLIASGIEKITDGIALIVRKEIKEEKDNV